MPCYTHVSSAHHIGGRKTGIHSLAGLVAVLKLVELAMAHVVEHISEGGLAAVARAADIPPALEVVLGAIERQRRREHHVDGFADGEGVQLGVDVEGHDGLGVGRGSPDAGNAVVLGLVEGGDGEVLVEERGVGGGRHGEGRKTRGVMGEIGGRWESWAKS